MTEKRTDIEKAIAGEKNLRVLINNIDDPIWLVDPNCNIIECNTSFKKWVSNFIGEELGTGDHVLYNGQNKIYLEKFEMCYQLALHGRSFRTVEDMKVDGATSYTAVSFNPVFDSDNKVMGISCFARDITEQRKHLLKIEQQNTALREIAYIESHKVRAPLANIMGLEQLFNHEDLTDPVNKMVVEDISQQSRVLDIIIREVVRKSNEMGLWL